MGKMKGFIVLEALVATATGASIMTMLYLLCAHASVYHARAAHWFAMTHQAVNVAHYMRAHAGNMPAVGGVQGTVQVTKNAYDGITLLTIDTHWTCAGHDESMRLQYCGEGT